MKFLLAFCTIQSFLIVNLFGQAIGSDAPPVIGAQVTTEAPIIDGLVIDDPVWQKITAYGGMTQVRPNAGKASSEKTEIRITYDDHTLYVSAVCYDAEAKGIVVTDARRDGDLSATDAFLMILDTYHDSQNGFVFGTNSVGTQYDAQVDNEGIGNFNNNRQQGGTIGGFNLNWDASWDVASTVGDYGWSCEFAIPLKTLRFGPGENQTWGVNFQRNITKTNELTYWAPLPINFNLYRLSLAGDLVGLNLKKPGNLKLIPYALANRSIDNSTEPNSSANTAQVGVDLKYSITPSMTLDVTYNTDFAQVEVDDQQVNLDRFSLFFPEKRPFFLENAGLFSVGSPGEVDLFFSRRIGIASNGQQVPIVGGARLSGRINQTDIGVLSMFTEDSPELGLSGDAFTVARANHQFNGRSNLGGIFVNRSGLGEDNDNSNSTFAIDGKYGIGNAASISGFLSQSSTPGIDGKQGAYKITGDYDWNNWIMRVGYTEVQEGFNPEVGFLFRQAFRKPEALVLYKYRLPESSPFLEFRPHIAWRGYWNPEGFQETGWLHIDNHWEWKSGTEVHTGVNFTKEGVVEDFQLTKEVIVPAGIYDHAEAQIVFFTNQNKPFSISTRHILGGFFGGKRYANSGTVRVRIGDKFTSEWSLSHNDIRLPYGDFTTDIFRSRISYSFTPNIFLQGLIQHNSVTSQWSSNIRFGWLQQANTGLFIVYNETREDSFLDNQSFTIKYSMLFDVLK